MTAPAIRFSRRKHIGGHVWGVIVDGQRVGYAWEDGTRWRARPVYGEPLPLWFPTRQAAAEALVGAK